MEFFHKYSASIVLSGGSQVALFKSYQAKALWPDIYNLHEIENKFKQEY
jgi:hypothetical protein